MDNLLNSSKRSGNKIDYVDLHSGAHSLYIFVMDLQHQVEMAEITDISRSLLQA